MTRSRQRSGCASPSRGYYGGRGRVTERDPGGVFVGGEVASLGAAGGGTGQFGGEDLVGSGSGRDDRLICSKKLARIHARVADVRADALHKAMSTLAAQYETVAAGDLNVAGMARNRRLARAISDQGFGRARQMLTYKTTWNGGQLITAGRFYPSSKTCSGRGAVKAKKLPLSERKYLCEPCGLVMDRDENAARNLLKLAASGAESQNACGPQVRPGLAGRSGMKQEPGTALAGETGTASGQPLAAGRQLTHAH